VVSPELLNLGNENARRKPISAFEAQGDSAEPGKDPSVDE
jgi:hypothetical protein